MNVLVPTLRFEFSGTIREVGGKDDSAQLKAEQNQVVRWDEG